MDDLFGDTTSNLTNAHEKDDPGDQALIDLVPIPSESKTPDTSDIVDPFAGMFD